jgi:hypothetical protein
VTKLRLVKVIVQPVFVVDDGESLVEQIAQPVNVPAAEWPTFATGRFLDGFDALRRQVEGNGQDSA